MKRVIAASLALALVAVASPEPRARADGPVTCVQFYGEARPWAYAYKHVVVLTSACTMTVDCTITTDANPEPITETLQPNEVREVVTFLSSPSRVFVPNVICNAK